MTSFAGNGSYITPVPLPVFVSERTADLGGSPLAQQIAMTEAALEYGSAEDAERIGRIDDLVARAATGAGFMSSRGLRLVLKASVSWAAIAAGLS